MPQFQKKASTTMREVEAELADLAVRIEQERQKRAAALLMDDGKTVDAYDLTIARLEKADGRAKERRTLLQAQVASEEREAVARRRAETIARVEKKLAEADAIAAELEADLINDDRKLRRIIQLREECMPVFALGDAHINASVGSPDGAVLTAPAIVTLLRYALYKIGARPYAGGVPGARVEVSWPGGLCPRIEWQLQQERIPSFGQAMRTASAFAVKLLRGESTPTAPEPQATITEPSPAVPSSNGGQSDSRMVALLKRQNELAADPAASDAEYASVVQQIADLTAGVTHG